MTLTPTEIEEIGVSIAEDQGWKPPIDCTAVPKHKWRSPKDGCCYHTVPPYTTSLDAIQAAAMERFKKEECMRTFAAMLRQPYRASVKDYIWQLSALDWCIAFARTAKIWRYKI